MAMLKSSRVSDVSLFALLAMPTQRKGLDKVDRRCKVDSVAERLCIMVPQPGSSPSNKFDNLPNLLAHVLAH